VSCDGVDTPRTADECLGEDGIILVLRGRFAFESARVRAVASPLVALCLRPDQRFRIRHPEGGDLCMSVRGVSCQTLVADGPTARGIDADSYLRIVRLAARAASGQLLDRLEVEETLCATLARPSAVQPRKPRERDIAHAIAYRVEHDLQSRLPLAVLAGDAGVSLYHACRAFRRVMGTSIHRYHLEVRLRHALALLLESDRSIVEVAADLGFANQAHLTSLVRQRFGTPPARIRQKRDCWISANAFQRQ
jgi:AraC-like DNA-binding protein